MALRRELWLLAALCVLCGATLPFGCGREEPARGGDGPRPTTQPAVSVTVETVKAQTLAYAIPIVGTLYPAEDAVISTKAAGVLRRTFVDLGAEVLPAAPLTHVDTADYDVAVRQAQAALAESLARLGTDAVPGKTFDLNNVSTVRRAAATLQNAKFSNERLLRMSTGGMAVVSEQELSDAATAVSVAEANHRLALDEAAALIATARERDALLKMAEQRLTDTLTSTPPIPTTLGRQGAAAWIVAARLVTEGQYVNVGDSLYRLIIRQPLKLRSKVPERYAPDVRSGQSIVLSVVGTPAALNGQISRISPAVDPTSRTFEIEALVDNPGETQKPGAFATGTIAAESAGGVVLVPAEAIVHTGGALQVFVVENGVAHRREVQTGRTFESRVEILTGLGDGERIAVRGAATLSDGGKVQAEATP